VGRRSPAVFLDRDGVINEVVFRDGKPESPRTLEEFRFVQGVAELLEKLRDSGYRLFVVSNQPDVARGLVPLSLLKQMTSLIMSSLPVERVLTCVHDDRDGCECRKPKPGMLLQVALSDGIDLSESFIIGDSWRDVQAARNAGCMSILLRKAYNDGVEAPYLAGSLAEAVDLIVRQEGTEMQAASYVTTYLDEVKQIAGRLSLDAMVGIIRGLSAIRSKGGRLFFLGVGGSAANASHAANDFRKIAGIECYAPTDNVAELTARINDEGWESSYANWLRGSRLNSEDGIFVLSVGGGHAEKKISANLVEAIKYARQVGAKVFGIVGRDGGYTAQVANACVVIPTVNQSTVTPHTEAFQAVVWHLIVSHPDLLLHEMKWESMP